MIYDLKSWSLHAEPMSPYAAPEQAVIQLGGLCAQRAVEVGLAPLEPILTSRVTGFDKATRIATTKSGSQYRLVGEPEAGYAEWCRVNGHADPVALLGSAAS